MGRNFMLVITVALLVAGALLSGCAGTAQGKPTSIYQHDAAVSVVDDSRSQADAMVVIRYPAVVHQDALPAYYRAFEQNAIGGAVVRSGQSRQDSDRIAQTLISKSSYFAMSLYRELSEALPDDSVLLSPHIVIVDDKNKLTSRPLLASEEIPSVVGIDFNVYSHPDPRKMMDAEPLTFGDIITPLFVIHSNRWLRPSTHGLLLSSQPLVGAAWGQSERQAEKQASSRLENQDFEFRRPLDFVTMLDRGIQPVGDIPLKNAGESRREVVAVEVHPLEKIRMDGAVMAQLANDHATDPFAEDFVKGASTRIVRALNQVDHDRATFFSRQIALSRFDPELARAFLSQSQSEDLRARLQMAEALIMAEKTFLSAQSRGLYDGTYDGVYGDQMRQMISAEYRLLEERRDLARAQNLNTALAIVAMAGAVYVGSNSNGGHILSSRTMSNALMLSSIYAMNSAISKNAQSKTVGENFLVQMAPAINRQVSVQVEWLESREEITAADFGEFRNKTLALYQDSVRGVASVFEPHCEFRHPALAETGLWFGDCENGAATASGYGLAVDAAGNTIEYLGSAQAGLADGVGAMIFRSPGEIGAIYYEGGFRQGLPEGVVLVEQPGQKPAVRSFRAGVDRGSADASQLQRVRF
jgi:hypothetical protein